MGIQDQKLKELAEKYKAGLCTAEEIRLIRQWYDAFETDGYELPPEEAIETASREAALAVIRRVAEMQNGPAKPVVPLISKRKNRFIRYAAAAVLLIVSSVGAYFYLKPGKRPVAVTRSTKNDFAAGTNKAVLTLSNGREIVLNTAKNGNLAQQGATEIHKTDSGLVAYQVDLKAAPPGESNASPFNTITTPRGGQYQVILPDGTKVWLNSVSSIRFPVAFTGSDRKVETTGEVYFEVTKDQRKPFIVNTAGQTVTVLGTHFNIMAYPDEATVVITLLEGSVKITKGKVNRTLRPGEQALVEDNIKVAAADTEDATAWKNGITSFTDADIKSIMRKVSRWYDIDVAYQGPVSDRLFNGAISRQSNLSGLLKILTLSHIQFSMEGKKLIVKQ
jgi:ferric-dicitrate binding protein FerR (iron transport regulator)